MPFMRWDELEGAAFLYYYSRGVPLKLVAGFMHDKCKNPEGPRPIEDLRSAVANYPFLRNGTDCDLPKTNGMILELTAEKKIKWKDFLEKLEFGQADKALLDTKGLLGIIEQTQGALDPPMTKAEQGSGYGKGYSRSTTEAMGTSGVHGPSPYMPPGTGSGPSAGSSTKDHGAEDLQSASEPAFQRSGYSDPLTRRYLPGVLPFDTDPGFQGSRYSDPRSTTGQAASPPPPDRANDVQFGTDPRFQGSRYAEPPSTTGQPASTKITGRGGAHKPHRGGRGGR